MNYKKVIKNILTSFGHPNFILKSGKRITFARADISDAERIHKMDDATILKNAISLHWCMMYGSFSICDIQIESLYSLEIEKRDLIDVSEQMWNNVKDFHCNICDKISIDSNICKDFHCISCDETSPDSYDCKYCSPVPVVKNPFFG